MWCVVVCDLETSNMKSHGPRWAAAPLEKKMYINTKARTFACSRARLYVLLFVKRVFQPIFLDDQNITRAEPVD